LKFFFVGQRPDHCATLSIFEVCFECTTNLIFLVIMRTLLSECSLKILLLCQFKSVLIH